MFNIDLSANGSGKSNEDNDTYKKEPIIRDANLKFEKVFEGLDFPTSMAFLGPDDILVLEKNNGIVRRIVNGAMLPEPLLDVSVANKNERYVGNCCIKE